MLFIISKRYGKYLFLLHLMCNQNQIRILLSHILAFLKALKIHSRPPFLQLQVYVYISIRVCYSSHQKRYGKYLLLLYLMCNQNQIRILLSAILAFLKALKIHSRLPFLQLQVYIYISIRVCYSLYQKRNGKLLCVCYLLCPSKPVDVQLIHLASISSASRISSQQLIQK